MVTLTDKIHFETKIVTGHKKRTFRNDQKANLSRRHNKYNAPNNRVPKYIERKLTQLKGERDNSLIIVVNFNTSVSILEQPDRRPVFE